MNTNLNDLDKLELVEVNNNEVSISNKIDMLLTALEDEADRLANTIFILRNRILDAMNENDITVAQLANHKIARIFAKDSEIFNTDKFLKSESDAVIASFSKIVTTEKFDTEAFKKDNPELYYQYTEIIDNIEVDTKKLAKTLPDVYKSYTTIVKSNKEPTLRINRTKESTNENY